MKGGMTTMAVIFLLGSAGPGQAAQQGRKPDQDRVRSGYESAAKKCEGLKGEVRTACLKDAQAATSQGKGADGAKSGTRMPDEKKY